MSVNWKPCEQLEQVARRLIAERHEDLNRPEVLILFGARDDRPMEGGEYEKLWFVSKVTGEKAFHLRGRTSSDPLFTLSIPEHIVTGLDEPTFEALVDEALCAMEAGEDDEGAVKISRAPFDYRGYLYNLEEYGPWHERSKKMLEAAKGAPQLSLDLDGPRPALEIAGMGALGEDEDGSVPAEFRHQAPCGCVVDRRLGEDCPIHGAAAYAPTDAERAEVVAAVAEEAATAAPVLEVVAGGAAPNGDGHQEAAPARRRVPKRALRQMTGEGDDASAAA